MTIDPDGVQFVCEFFVGGMLAAAAVWLLNLWRSA